MSTITIEFGSCPSEEDCAQVGSEGYELRAREECRVFMGQLRRTYFAAHSTSLATSGVDLKVKSNPHDFGSWLEVVGTCDEADEKAVNALIWVENNIPTNWDEESRWWFDEFSPKSA